MEQKPRSFKVFFNGSVEVFADTKNDAELLFKGLTDRGKTDETMFPMCLCDLKPLYTIKQTRSKGNGKD